MAWSSSISKRLSRGSKASVDPPSSGDWAALRRREVWSLLKLYVPSNPLLEGIRRYNGPINTIPNYVLIMHMAFK
jgi:hypothetical protein